MGLTKQDVRAIKHADSLVFYHNTENEAGERGHWLKAIHEGRESSTGFRQEHWISLTDTHLSVYEGGMGEPRGDYPTKGRAAEDLYGVVVLQSVKVRMEVHTWVKNLREGDDLVLEFFVGNNSDVLRKAGLSHDLAWLTVHRKNAAGHNMAVGKYFLDDLIVDVWSPVRMVRPVLAHH
jgi:hypothetical protein